jgi:hypothetical protein
MTRSKVVPPERDRRRTEHVTFEPLRVRLDGTREGILVDLSEGEALLQRWRGRNTTWRLSFWT